MARKASRWFVAAVVGASALAASPAHANFIAPYTTRCSGESAVIRGASSQVALQAALIPAFNASCPATSHFRTSGQITFQPTSSAVARAAFGSNATGVRDTTVRAIAQADAPSAAETAAMNAGVGGPLDDGILHLIPIASTGLPILVNYPNGCSIPNQAAYKKNLTDFTTRIHVPNAKLEAAFAGDASVDTWGELVLGISELPGSGRAAGSCAAQPIIRVVRADSAGTTTILKDWFAEINPARGWTDPSLPNTGWPNDSGIHTTTKVTSLAPQAAKIALTDGAIGWNELSTARANGFDMAPATSALTADTVFWIPVANRAGQVKDPQANALGYKVGGTKGANCSGVQYRNVPTSPVADPTLSDQWLPTVGVASAVGYPVCYLSYIGVWDDDADVYGNTAAEQGRARTIKDYVTFLASSAAQGKLVPNDYAKLPNTTTVPLLTIAQTGIAAVNWNKP